MENTDNELSNKIAAFFSWVEFLGMIVFITSRLFFRQNDWLALTSIILICSGYFYRIYADWKAGRKKSVKRRLLLFVLVVIAAAVFGYIAYQRNH
jgi:hypothetical protein